MTFYEMIEQLSDGKFAYRESLGQSDCTLIHAVLTSSLLSGNIHYYNEFDAAYEFSKEDFYATDWRVY